MALSRSLFKRVLDGNRWDARIYDYFVQRRYGPYEGNKPPGERIQAGEPGEVHASSTGGAKAESSTNESLGARFYIILAALPLSFAAYKYSSTPSPMTDTANSPSSRNDTRPFLTRLIDRFRDAEDENDRRNALHTEMLDVAARDRNLFYGSPREAVREIANPESFNTGSPYNIPPSHSVDLSSVASHYRDLNLSKSSQQLLRQQRREAEEEASAERARLEKDRLAQMGWVEWLGAKMEMGGSKRGGEERRSMGIGGEGKEVPSGRL